MPKCWHWRCLLTSYCPSPSSLPALPAGRQHSSRSLDQIEETYELFSHQRDGGRHDLTVFDSNSHV
jgi:hypothetical protein